jgi:hypothetical protein
MRNSAVVVSRSAHHLPSHAVAAPTTGPFLSAAPLLRSFDRESL